MSTPSDKPGDTPDVNTVDEKMPPLKRKVRHKDEKVCCVCGDKALGYNFNAMTCESCKAFFRRNALKQNNQPCLFQGDCKIDMRTRRFCPHCRLNKCLMIGMKKEMILDDSMRKARMQKVIDNRKRRKSSNSKSEDDNKAIVKEEPISENDMSPDQSGCSYSDMSSGFSGSGMSCLVDAFQKEQPEDTKYLQTPPELENLGSPKDPSEYRTLLTAEHVLFEELGSVYSSTLGEMVTGSFIAEKNYNSSTDLINHSEITVRRLIKFIKRLADFQQLCTEDQVTALKACALSSILLRSACFYSLERDSWITSNGEISTSILKKSTGYSEIHMVHTQFCQTIKQLIGNNNILFALIQVICVFNPDSKDLKGKCIISNIQDKYLILLKHYLESEFTFGNSAALYAKLINTISEMKTVHDAHSAILLQANVSEIEPLMLEVLDLKHKVG